MKIARSLKWKKAENHHATVGLYPTALQCPKIAKNSYLIENRNFF